MNNLSLAGEKVDFLCKARKFIIFDILYIEDMKPAKSLFISDKSMADIESEIFQWSDGEQIGFYELNQYDELVPIRVNEVKRHNGSKKIDSDKIFGTDTGVIALVDWNCISSFLDSFNYDDFVDTLPNYEDAQKYLKNLNSITPNSFAIISTPGLNKGYDFVGSGRYYIESDCLL